MKTQLSIVFLLASVACGHTHKGGAPAEPTADEPAVDAPAATPADAPKLLPRAPEPIRATLPSRSPIQAGYRTTEVVLSDGTVLDDGEAELEIDASSKPPRVSLRVEAGGDESRIAATFKLDAGEFWARGIGDPRPIVSQSIVQRYEVDGSESTIEARGLKLERLTAPGKRTQFLLRAVDEQERPLLTVRTQFEISCFVPAELLGKPKGRMAEDSAPAVLLEPDIQLQTEVCRPFIALL